MSSSDETMVARSPERMVRVHLAWWWRLPVFVLVFEAGRALTIGSRTGEWNELIKGGFLLAGAIVWDVYDRASARRLMLKLVHGAGINTEGQSVTDATKLTCG